MPGEEPIACTLSADDRQSRAAAVRELGGRALVGLEVSDRRARLRFRGERERVDARVAAESQCCAFFQFATSHQGDETQLEIQAPEGGEPLLRGLVAAIVGGWQGAIA